MAELHVPGIHAEPVTTIAGWPITNSILGTWLAMLVLFGLLWLVVRRSQTVPGRLQAGFEIMVEEFRTLVGGVMEDERLTKRYLPLVISIFLFVLFVNLVALLPGFGTIGSRDDHGTFVPWLRAGSSDLNLTLALAALSFLVAQLAGIFTVGFLRYGSKFINLQGLWKRPWHIKHALMAVPLFFLGVVELISELAKLISLSFRLFGNIYAGEVLLVVFGFLLPVFIPLSGPFYILEVFVGLIQAFVFAMLTIVFIKIATLPAQH